MRQGVIGMGTLTILVTSLLFKLASRILLVMFVFWLIGFLYPFVAIALGIPQLMFYDLVASAVHSVGNAFHDAHDASQCVR